MHNLPLMDAVDLTSHVLLDRVCLRKHLGSDREDSQSSVFSSLGLFLLHFRVCNMKISLSF